MNQFAKWIIVYGGFLILAGVLGFVSNPEKAKTALISGGTFGSLSILWGILGLKGFAWSRKAAIATVIFLGVVFAWRSIATWMVYLDGRSEKLFAACLISAMLGATVVTIMAFVKKRI